MKEFFSIIGNAQALDGGAMFGNVPKAMWSNWIEPDDENRITLACRSLLVKDEDRTILLEAGIGSFFEPKYRDRYGVIESEHVLLQSLDNIGISHEDIDVVILSHLHFDHVGGLLAGYEERKGPELLFPNATFIVGEEAWGRAKNPHPRDRASFIPGFTELLYETNRLYFVPKEKSMIGFLGADYKFHYSQGHTPGMMLTEIKSDNESIIFCADLIPGTPWIHVPVTMGYDRFPEQLINEKVSLLERATKQGIKLFFTHDPEIAYANVAKNEKGQFHPLGERETLFGRL